MATLGGVQLDTGWPGSPGERVVVDGLRFVSATLGHPREPPPTAFHSPGVQVAPGFSATHLNSPPPRLLLPPTVHPREISDAWSSPEEETFLGGWEQFWERNLCGGLGGAGGESSRGISPPPPRGTRAATSEVGWAWVIVQPLPVPPSR